MFYLPIHCCFKEFQKNLILFSENFRWFSTKLNSKDVYILCFCLHKIDCFLCYIYFLSVKSPFFLKELFLWPSPVVLVFFWFNRSISPMLILRLVRSHGFSLLAPLGTIGMKCLFQLVCHAQQAEISIFESKKKQD